MANSANPHNKPFYYGKPQNSPPPGTRAGLVIAVLTILVGLGTPEIRCQLHLHSESCSGSIAEDFYQKGSVLLRLERNREALDSFEEAIEIDPNQAKVWNRRGVALEKLGKNQQALASYDKAFLLDPSYEIARQHREALLQKLSKKSSKGSL